MCLSVPGWFYHESEDSLVKTPDELFDIYLNSIGRGSTLLLNLAPDKRGLIPDMDVKFLLQWKNKIDKTFSNNLASGAKATTDSSRGNSSRFAASNLTDGNKESYWSTDDSIKSGTIELTFDSQQRVQYVVLQEYIKLGQRVKTVDVEVFKNGQWEKVANATTIGYKRIVRIDSVETAK